MYPENSLCVAKVESVELAFSQFKTDKFYRVSFDADQKGCIVFGEWMPIEKFEQFFELVVPLLQKKLATLLGDKKVSFAEFKRRANVHVYGRGLRASRIVFIGSPKENLFGFYPMQSNKAESLKESYEYYLRLLDGDFEVIDDKDVQWGNCGIPIGYGDLRKQGVYEPTI